MPSLKAHIDTVLERDKFKFIDRVFFRFCRPVTVKILIVVDGSINFSQNGFGLGLVVETLRDPKHDFVRFDLDLASREGSYSETSNPGLYQKKYDGFRFDKKKNGKLIIDNYDQIWLFGFAPGNDAGPDSNIEAHSTSVSQSELVKLTKWMNIRQGGLLAMGDHDYLGATMCWKIPRVRHMRRWTNAQGVPPIGGAAHPDTHLRHDTNQPRTAGQIAGTDFISFSNQGDSLPQTIEPRRYSIGSGIFLGQRNYEPHPILCSPEHGVIDILPDHPHEGWLYEDNEISASTSYSWNGGGDSVSGKDFPTSGGHQQMPEVIAWATTTPNPPYLLSKGASPRKRFPVIGVYDGHKSNVGRVATDATWHHWFSENLIGMKNDPSTNHYEILQEYFRNTAIWLARPGQQSSMFSVATWNSMFTVQGMQELGPIIAPHLIGPAAKDIIGRRASQCTISRWTWDYLLPEIYHWRRKRLIDPQCLSCPPFEILEAGALGILIQELLPLRTKILNGKLDAKGLDKNVEKAFKKAIKRAAPEVMETMKAELGRDYRQLQKQIKAMG